MPPLNPLTGRFSVRTRSSSRRSRAPVESLSSAWACVFAQLDTDDVAQVVFIGDRSWNEVALTVAENREEVLASWGHRDEFEPARAVRIYPSREKASHAVDVRQRTRHEAGAEVVHQAVAHCGLLRIGSDDWNPALRSDQRDRGEELVCLPIGFAGRIEHHPVANGGGPGRLFRRGEDNAQAILVARRAPE